MKVRMQCSVYHDELNLHAMLQGQMVLSLINSLNSEIGGQNCKFPNFSLDKKKSKHLVLEV